MPLTPSSNFGPCRIIEPLGRGGMASVYKAYESCRGEEAMTRVEETVIVDAPVHAVFAYASDWRRWPEWFEGVSDFRPTTEVTRGTGARYAYRARLMGIPARVETEIRDFVEDSGWTGVSTRGLPHRTFWRFEAQGQSTRFTYALEYQLPVPLLGALADRLVVKRQWRRIIGKSLSNLRSHFSDT